MEGIELSINHFIEEWEYYCYPDKTEKCKRQVEEFLASIDQMQDETNEGKKKEKAKLLYLKGKILDLLPTYEKSAEEYLNKSIKLNPTNGDCWNTLAHVLFKKNDIEGSQKALEMALENKGKNKVSLRYQSVLLRTQGKSDEQRRKNKQQSLKIIKDALLLDMKDGATWYFLGNAYFSNFISNFKKFDELENAIKAYNQAEQFFKHKYPDLYLNRGNVEAHMEEYESAIKNLERAQEIDPTLNCIEKITNIRKRMEYAKTCFERASELKKSKVEEILKTIPNKINNNKDHLQICCVKQLKERYNPKKLLSTKIISKITSAHDIPSSYLAMDNEGTFLSISIYNANQKIDQKIKKDALVTIIDPELKKITFNGFSYTTIQIFELFKVTADGSRLTKQEFNPNQVFSETFSK